MRLTSWLTGELDLSLSRARFSDFDPAGDFIPGALDRVIAGTITIDACGNASSAAYGCATSVRVRSIEDNSEQSEATTILER